MKHTIKHIAIFIIIISFSQLLAQRYNSGQIAVRIISENTISTGLCQSDLIKLDPISTKTNEDVTLVNDMSISNSTLTGWELTAESMNKGKLKNGTSELSYSIGVCESKVNLATKTKVLSTEGHGKMNSVKFDLKMNISNEDLSEDNTLLTGNYKDTINFTLYSND